MRISVKAVIFDYGNVLSDAQPLADLEAMASILDLELPAFDKVYWKFRVEYDAGSLDAVTYWNHVAQDAAQTLTPAQIAALAEVDGRSWSHPGPLMPEWASELRVAGFKTAILSNMPGPVRDYLVRCPWLPEFDVQTFSCDVGSCKPEPAIYRKCLGALGVEPADVLFLDDRESNVSAATNIGLHAVKFASPHEAASEIEHRFSLPVISFNKNNCL